MAAKDPTDALQAGVYALLTADATLMALVTGVYDGPPENVEPRYVTIGTMVATPDGTHGLEGRQTTVQLDTWARAEGYASVNVVGTRLVALLWHRHADLDAQVAGHKVWRIEHEYSQTLDDPEPGLRHRVDRFRVYTAQEAP